MKKLLLLVSIILCCSVLFACSNNETNNTETPAAETPASETPATETPSTETPAPMTINAFVTISNKGEAVIKQESIVVTDKNDDKKIDIDEVLFAAHKLKNKENDYSSYVHEQYGLSLSKLWGETGALGYYLNDQSCRNLADEVKEGDYVTAFVYVDQQYWNDSYSYFNIRTLNAVKGEEIALTLKNNSYDSEWNPVVAATPNAGIIINGEQTSYVTDAEGTVKLTFSEAGTYYVTATATDVTLVPSFCVITVK